jgi:hypothetical protein
MTQLEIDRLHNDLTEWRFRAGLLAMCLLGALVLIVVIMVHYKGCPR